ncbi:MAG: regulatory signaling modulator protein AmpE [Spiribacter sp.]|nr:regulatory signaling modulator protein AmpE [Spiribacter sp.]
MTLIALLAALLLNAYLPPGGWRSARGLFRYAGWLRARLMPTRLWNGAAGVVALILPIIVALGVVQWLLGDVLLGLGGLILGVFALAFAFGGGDTLETEVSAFTVAWRRGDQAASDGALGALAGGPVESMALEAQPEAATEYLFCRARTRLFAPIFWFVVLGPVGAVGYRLSVLARAFGQNHDNAGPEYCAAASRWLGWLDYLPDRLMAFAMALAGHFSAAWQAWEETREDNADRRLSETGIGALGLPVDEGQRDLTISALDDAHALLRRAMYCWLAVVALGSLFGLG